MASYRLPRFPDRKTIQNFISRVQPQAGRIIGALSGMILAGPAWLYGLCVGLLLGYMVDILRTKAAAAAGSAGTAEADRGLNGEGTGSTDTGTGESPDGTAGGLSESEAYQLLGLLPGASVTEVKKAWRARSRQAHPDAPGGEAENFMALKSAYEMIMHQKGSSAPGH